MTQEQLTQLIARTIAKYNMFGLYDDPNVSRTEKERMLNERTQRWETLAADVSAEVMNALNLRSERLTELQHANNSLVMQNREYRQKYEAAERRTEAAQMALLRMAELNINPPTSQEALRLHERIRELTERLDRLRQIAGRLYWRG